MQNLRVFLSSTCFDLNRERTAIQKLLTSSGHTPILSNKNNIRYDPDTNSHNSCLNEVENGTDYMILIISKRFGSSIFRESFEHHINTSEISVKSRHLKYFRSNNKYSITHCEFFKALELNIPYLIFISKEVSDSRNRYYEYLKKHKTSKGFLGLGIKNEIDIYEFITFINHLRSGNGSHEYKSVGEIKKVILSALSDHFKTFLKRKKENSGSNSVNFLPDDKQKFTKRLLDKLSDDYKKQRAKLEIENILIFDKYGNCNYNLKVKVIPQTPYYIYYFQIYPDRLGEIVVKKLRNIDQYSDERHLGIIKDGTGHFFLFNSTKNVKKPFTIELSLFVENYLSDLLTEGTGHLLKQLHDSNKKYINVVHEMRFPAADFKNLKVVCKQIPDNSRLNKQIPSKIVKGNKIFKFKLTQSQLFKEKNPVIRLEFTM